VTAERVVTVERAVMVVMEKKRETGFGDFSAVVAKKNLDFYFQKKKIKILSNFLNGAQGLLQP